MTYDDVRLMQEKVQHFVLDLFFPLAPPRTRRPVPFLLSKSNFAKSAYF
jgi:hypothetical protein